MTNVDSISKELLALKEFFLTAQKALDEGNVVGMAGIDVRISKVCIAAQEAPADKQKEYLPELNLLISLLATYESSLREFQASKLAEMADAVSKDGDA